MSTRASVTVLKAKLSAYIKRVKQGEEVQVFEHEHLVARLLPPEQDTLEISEPARGGPKAWSKLSWPVVLKGGQVLARFLEERHRESAE